MQDLHIQRKQAGLVTRTVGHKEGKLQLATYVYETDYINFTGKLHTVNTINCMSLCILTLHKHTLLFQKTNLYTEKYRGMGGTSL